MIGIFDWLLGFVLVLSDLWFNRYMWKKI